MENLTISEYEREVAVCREIFLRKLRDYGSSWKIMRLPSVTDQIYIKALRIRSIEQKGQQKIGESIETEFRGILNYCVIALLICETDEIERGNWTNDIILLKYDEKIDKAKKLMINKNHDYGEAWRSMRLSSITDIILMKIHRIKQIEDNAGLTFVSEGVDANYLDLINYSLFALIHLQTKD